MKNKILIDLQEDLEKPIWFDNVEKFVLLAMEKLNFTNEEVSILFCNNSYIQELNNSYRNINSPTDVLSFENEPYQITEFALLSELGVVRFPPPTPKIVPPFTTKGYISLSKAVSAPLAPVA